MAKRYRGLVTTSVHVSTEKAAVLIAIDDGEKVAERWDFVVRPVGVALEMASAGRLQAVVRRCPAATLEVGLHRAPRVGPRGALEPEVRQDSLQASEQWQRLRRKVDDDDTRRRAWRVHQDVIEVPIERYQRSALRCRDRQKPAVFGAGKQLITCERDIMSGLP